MKKTKDEIFAWVRGVVAIGIVGVYVGGCGMRTEEMAVAQDPNTNLSFGDVCKNAIQVQKVTSSQPIQTMDDRAFMRWDPNDIKSAIADSLNNYGLLSHDVSSAKFNLNAHVILQRNPRYGFEKTSQTHIRYVLKDTNTGQNALDDLIESSHTINMAPIPSGAYPPLVAVEGSIRKNIEKFLSSLSKTCNAVQRS